MRTIPLLLLAAGLVACSEARSTGIPVSRADYGERWPFTMEAGTIRCTPEGPQSTRTFVTLDTGTGIQFGLNGAARTFGYPDVTDALQAGKTLADVQPFIALGLPLCP